MNPWKFLLCFLFTGAVALAEELAPQPLYVWTKGSIREVDLAAGRLVLESGTNVLTLVVSRDTYVFRGKEKLSMDQLKAGDFIKLTYSRTATGAHVVRRIKIDPPETPPTP